MSKCTKIAEYSVAWGGKQVLTCEEHGNHLSTLGNVIGSPVQAIRIKTTDQCTMEETPKEEK